MLLNPQILLHLKDGKVLAFIQRKTTRILTYKKFFESGVFNLGGGSQKIHIFLFNQEARFYVLTVYRHNNAYL